MSKIIKNTIKYVLGMLAILVVGLLILTPDSTEAANRPGTYNGYSRDFVDTSYSPSFATSNGYNSNPNNGQVLGANTKATTTKQATPVPATDYKEVKEEFSDVTANALYGADSFFPSSLVGWLLFAIFVLVIIVLARKFTGLESKYHSTPLKHS